jgi:hypothetical protein
MSIERLMGPNWNPEEYEIDQIFSFMIIVDNMVRESSLPFDEVLKRRVICVANLFCPQTVR